MNINSHGLMFLVRRTFTVSSNCRFYSSASSHTSNKLFVAGLSWSVDEKSLKDAFSSFGDVTEVRIMYDKETGRSRGFGFVNFIKESEAESAKQAMDGKAMMGRPLRICFALDQVRGGHVVVPRLLNPEGSRSREKQPTRSQGYFIYSEGISKLRHYRRYSKFLLPFPKPAPSSPSSYVSSSPSSPFFISTLLHHLQIGKGKKMKSTLARHLNVQLSQLSS